MKRIFTFLSLMAIAAFAIAQDHIVETVGSSGFNPSALTISVGETVQFVNTGGMHNVNGTQTAYPDNPESFGNDVALGWTFDVTFNTPGFYNYHCDPHLGNQMVGTITVVEMATSGLVIAGIADAQPSGGAGPKALELIAIEDIPDLSIYGVGVANNGDGSDGIEYTFPAESLSAGDCIIITDNNNEAQFLTFFGFAANYIVPGGGSSAVGFNGNDAVELFMDGVVVDVYGDPDVDGGGTTWEYTDGWVYRTAGTGPDATFVESNWTNSGIDALQDDVFTMNSEFANPFPNCSSGNTSNDITANDDAVNLPMNMPSSIDILANDLTPNGVATLEVTSVSINGTAVPNGTTDITYTPNPDFCGMDEVTYQICDATSCSQATVMITIDCPVLYPAYDIGTVTADADGDGLGDSLNVSCTLTGVVYGIDMIGADDLSFTIIDSQNEGINVFNFDLIDNYVVNEGDEITVQGEIIHFRGLTEIVPVTINVNSTGNMLFDPTEVTSLGEDTESQLIIMTSMTIVDETQWLGDGSSFNVDITDGTNTFTMRIDDDTDASSMPVPTGSLAITGIGGQFDNDEPYTEGYQILPRYMADIVDVFGGFAVNPELAEKINSYPNPVSELLQIDSEIELDEIWITNVMGQRVGDWSEPDTQLSIDVSAFQSGVYFLTVVKEGGVWTSSFVKE